ncbi:heme/hemin ABC transporter substrate-binding protein [Dyadobacter tibetensis]|uniref:heme/hemin ABC transporter substrate-binding protein n=1 Tax=Dyadobacter tibetensis TaxID=1211851 RepID=UPI0004AE245A|nr:ABC transporter substrate-binding protein [Dyadobacter tibetensis]
MQSIKYHRSLLVCLLLFWSVEVNAARIVSCNGTLSEIVAGLGLAGELVGVDVTSTYPESLHNLPKIGHNRSFNAEGILALRPNVLIYSDQSPVSANVLQQLRASGIAIVAFKQQYTKAGTIALIRAVGRYFKKSKEAEKMVAELEKSLKTVMKPTKPKKLLFIYARGTGTLMVAGQETSLDEIFTLTGHQNAVQGFSDFKPLTAESLVMANPDVLVLFDSGLQSLEGPEGLLKIPGVSATNAGKNKKIVSMDGQLLTGFGPRLGQAAMELSQKIE